MSHCSSLAAVGRSRRIEIPPSAAEFKREKVELKENIESEAKYPGHNAIRSRFSCCCRRVWGKGVAGRKQLDQINRLAPFQQPVANNKRWQAKKNAARGGLFSIGGSMKGSNTTLHRPYLSAAISPEDGGNIYQPAPSASRTRVPGPLLEEARNQCSIRYEFIRLRDIVSACWTLLMRHVQHSSRFVLGLLTDGAEVPARAAAHCRKY